MSTSPAGSASAADRFAHMTAAQRGAVTTTQGSILVSAAAGSGKTTVLAERCAYLVCDLPPAERCRVDELLVVTFTDAAAGEMRTRIGAALRQRLDERPTDPYLREQLYLLDSASISTIHAFCRTLIQRWFPQARVDPQAAVLSGDEAALLQEETLDQLLTELYGRDDELSSAFQRLVDEYGAGDDRLIRATVRQIHDFISSLPDPQAWLDLAVRNVDIDEPGGLVARVDELQSRRLGDELDLQIDYCAQTAEMIRQCWPIATIRADAVADQGRQLGAWKRALGTAGGWEKVAEGIREFTFEALQRRPRRLSDADKEAFDAATEVCRQARSLLDDRLRERLCRFTAKEYREGLARIAPHVLTFTQLLTAFNERYEAAKSAQAVVDFNDLQRGALRVLTDEQNPQQPSVIARQLQQQYRYVLVDEFQDVDPLQESILRLVSRESADPPAGNLFTVGDIKQSIYRFRLAEPKLFTARADRFTGDDPLGRAIHLQENFRSRSGIIDAINALFRGLMSRSFGGSAYDSTAELRMGASYPDTADEPMFGKPAVELHLLEPITEHTRRDADEESGGDEDLVQEELEGIEREAWLIGQRICTWMGRTAGAKRWCVAGRPASPGQPPLARPIDYGDIVILLRAMPHKAEPMAEVLRRMHIPVRIEGAVSTLDSAEFRDVYSLLQVLDNLQQDIPLAAVLRSPVLGDPFSESDLLRMRTCDRAGSFHEVVRHYVDAGEDAALRDRGRAILARLERYRMRIRSEPVADVLWDIYEETSYFTYVAGLPEGAQRQGQLVHLHELARQFGRFARQGLRRFLRFLEDMVKQDRPGPARGASSAGDNAVRIMTIHASKGLEFPVVILADLQKRFNLTDSRGPVLVDRELGLAMMVSDAERRVRYPTLLHQLAAEHSQRESLSEEMRVLYVALTRAREHLLLVGRYVPDKVLQHRRGHEVGAASRPLSQLQLESTSNPLDWLLPALGRLLAGMVHWPGEATMAAEAQPLFEVHTYTRETTDGWQLSPAVQTERREELAAHADLRPLPADEPMVEPAKAEAIVDRLTWSCPGLELTSVPARLSVTDLKRRWNATVDIEERPHPARRADVPCPAFIAGATDDATQRRGTVTHRFLQLVELKRPCDVADLKQQHGKLIDAGRLATEDAGLIDLDAAAWFFATQLGETVRSRAADVQREVPFVSRVAPERYDALIHPRDHRDVILVRGMVDLLLSSPGELQILDYKTDRIDASQCDARTEAYMPQIRMYADAMQAAYGRTVSKCWLVFLHPRRIVSVSGEAD